MPGPAAWAAARRWRRSLVCTVSCGTSPAAVSSSYALGTGCVGSPSPWYRPTSFCSVLATSPQVRYADNAHGKEFAMNKILEGITCLLFALILAAPSLSAQESSAAARTRPSVASPPAPSTRPPSPALTSALNDLDRITSATEADISNMDGG